MKQFIRTVLQASSLILVMAIVMMTGCQPQPATSEHIQSLTDKYTNAWNTGNFDEWDAIVDSNFVRHQNLSPVAQGRDAIKKAISEFRTAYPDLKVTLDEKIYSGDSTAVGRWTLTGTNTGAGAMPATGKSVKIWGISILHTSNGKLSEEWVAYDNQAMMTQLGAAMPPPAAAKH
jgi:steroid delta-isomerase-like uncharacterized protein